MKVFLKKVLSYLGHYLISVIDRVIEFRLFKPIAISIITIFVIFKSVAFIDKYSNKSQDSIKETNIVKKYKVIFNENTTKFDLSKDQIFSHVVKNGDTILKILIDLGADESQIFALLDAMKKVYNPRSIVVGNELIVKYGLTVNYNSNDASNIDRKVNIKSLTIKLSSDEEIIVEDEGGSYFAKKNKIELIRAIERFYGEVKSGLYLDGVALGASSNVMMNMINLYSYDIDFQRDIRNGDKFELVVETYYTKDGQKARDGNILYASITVRGKPIPMYMYKYRNNIEYFNKNGDSVKKSLLRTPVNGARVSSRYGMRRHPILGYSRMHRGIDFAAPTGTPILAAGSGIITFRGRNGGYGNHIKIRHNSQYTTTYSHISRFNSRFRRNSRVKQGDVIAYVGSTGRSTGPHLHFEVIKYGKHINPANVKATSGIKLKGADYKKFVEVRDQIESYRKNLPNQIHLKK